MSSSAAPRIAGEWLRHEAKQDPDRDFFRCGEDWLTLGQLDEQSDRFAAGLQELGLVKGDRLPIMLPNCTEYLVAVYGCAKAGVVQVPINTYLRGEFLRHQLAQSGATVMLTDALGVQQVKAVADRLPSLRRLIALGDPIDDTVNFAAVAGSTAELSPVDLSASDLCVIMYTSGTTGPSKGCMISHGYYTLGPEGFRDAGWFRAGDRLFGAMPMFHVGGQSALVGAALAIGGSVVIEPEFSAATFMARAREAQATALFGVGAMAVALLAQPRSDGERDHRIRQASFIPMTPAMQSEFGDRFGVAVVSELYGQSECYPVTIGVVGDEARPGSAGRRVSGVDVVLMDEDDQPVMTGEVGEICVRADPHRMFEGYWQDASATAEASRHLWHHTGDNGRFDADGFLYFVDRKKDSMRRRGENVSSVEVEQALLDHPAIAAIAVHAVPSEVTEDDIKACIVLHDGALPTFDDLFRFFKTAVPYYAVPRYVEFVDALPVNVNGRVLKYQLRQVGVNDQTVDLNALGLTIGRGERR